MASKRPAALLALLACLLASAAQAAPPVAAPVDLAHWGLHCFCITARHTPQRVVRADDNGRLLWLARDGATAEHLRAVGATATDSQILLLKTYGLLSQDGDRLTTAFPVVGPETLGPVRAGLRKLAERTAPALAPDAAAIAAELAATGHPDHAYAVVFGYALDGLLWDELRRRSALPDTTLDLDHPIWRGAFWAIYPERSGTPGTNEIVEGDHALVSVWTDHTLAPLNALLQPDKAGARPADPDGVPTIHDVAGDPIHDHAAKLAAAVARELMDTAEARALLASIPRTSRQEAVLILAHEFIWDLTDSLVDRKTIGRPAALDAASPTPAQLGELIFLRAPH